MIFYFSATGNNKYVATKIAAATGDSIISISDCTLSQERHHIDWQAENISILLIVFRVQKVFP